MFKKFRQPARTGNTAGTPSGKGGGAGSSQTESPDTSQAPDRSPPPRLELPRRRNTPGLSAGPTLGSAKLAHLKSVEPSGAAARPVAQPLAQPAGHTASRPVTPPLARPASPAQPSVPARPVIPPYPVPGARPKATGSAPGAEVQSFGGLMLVGPQIQLSGEIAACERLVVEGVVEGEVSDTGRLEVARHGRFRGTARVDSCALDGDFEGELEVRGVLSLKSNGRFTGTVRYGEIEIERGGVIVGDFGLTGDRATDQARGQGKDARAGTPAGPRRA